MTDDEQTTEAEPIEGEATEVDPEPEQAGVMVRAGEGGPGAEVTPPVSADELVARLDVIKAAAERAMTKDVDYGEIPGTDKPTLLKPGAEKLGVLFQLDIQVEPERHWADGGHLTVIAHATVYHAPTGARLGSGKGICSTRERKYAYRRVEITCPECGKQAVIKGKAEFGGGWLCWKKKNGCGTKWPDDSSQAKRWREMDQWIENPDLADTWNTVEKMAGKRARVDAVLAVTGASALFTQDVEDMGQRADDDAKPEAPPFGPKVNKKQLETMINALTYVHDGDAQAAKKTAEALKAEHDGYIPLAVARGAVAAAKVIKDRDEADMEAAADAGESTGKEAEE